VPDDSRLLNLEGLGQGVDADGCVFHVQAIFRNIGITNARQIRRNHGKFLGQKWNDWPPHARGLGVAVQQDYGRTVTGSEVVQLEPVNHRNFRGYRLRSASLRGQ
jgi:hypothetical protein